MTHGLQAVVDETELRIQVAVPYALRGELSADNRYLVFTEPVGHQVVTMWVLAAMAASGVGVCALAMLAGYPNPLLMAFGIGLGCILAVFIGWRARKIKSRELRIDTTSGHSFFGEANGVCHAKFNLNEAQLRVLRVTARNRGQQPWGYAVVVSAPGVRFPLAAARDEATLHSYIDGLPQPLQARLDYEISMAEVEHLWPRGLRS